MEKEEDIHDELKAFAFGIKDKPSPAVPPDYFEQLPDRILQRWKLERTAPAVKQFTLRHMIASAAVVSGICLGIVWWTNESSQLHTSGDISEAEAYQYIMEHINEFAPLMYDTDPLADESSLDLPPTNAIEEYLIEELDGDQLESIF